MDVVLVSCRGLLATMFLVSVMSKLRSRVAWQAFVASVHELRLLPERSVGPVAAVVMTAEVVSCALLVTPLAATAQAGFGLSSAMLAAFTVVIAVTVRRGLVVPCRCFGVAAAPLRWRHVVRNAVLAAVAFVGLFGGLGAGVGPSGVPAGSSGPAVVVGLSTGLVVAVVVIVLDDLLELFTGQPVTGRAPRTDTGNQRR